MRRTYIFFRLKYEATKTIIPNKLLTNIVVVQMVTSIALVVAFPYCENSLHTGAHTPQNLAN